MDPTELENSILKAAAMRRKMKYWRDSNMTTGGGENTCTTKILLPEACSRNTTTVLLGGENGSQILEIDLFVRVADEQAVTYGMGTLKSM